MHFSRMHTARLLPVSRGMHCSWGMYLVLGVYLLRGVPGPGGVPGPRAVTWSWGLPGPGGVHLVRGVYLVLRRGDLVSGVHAQVLPPCGQTNMGKNITFANFVCRQ